MEATKPPICAHPAGESENHAPYPSGSWPVDTPGGRFYAEWDAGAPVTREGQLIFFFQFLQAGGRWEEFLRDCPLHYTGSHVYHSYFVAGLRISLGVEVRPGNEHAAAKGLPGLWRTLEKLPRHQWPVFVRGDCGCGSETVMLEHEQRGLPYLFKLRHTAKVRELVVCMMSQGARWQDCGEGWWAMETSGCPTCPPRPNCCSADKNHPPRPHTIPTCRAPCPQGLNPHAHFPF